MFRAKRADRIKLLIWDQTGMVLVHKRLEDGKFVWHAGAGRSDADVAGAAGGVVRGAGLAAGPAGAGAASAGGGVIAERRGKPLFLLVI